MCLSALLVRPVVWYDTTRRRLFPHARFRLRSDFSFRENSLSTLCRRVLRLSPSTLHHALALSKLIPSSVSIHLLLSNSSFQLLNNESIDRLRSFFSTPSIPSPGVNQHHFISFSKKRSK